jgi:hypothetical protein
MAIFDVLSTRSVPTLQIIQNKYGLRELFNGGVQSTYHANFAGFFCTVKANYWPDAMRGQEIWMTRMLTVGLMNEVTLSSTLLIPVSCGLNMGSGATL